MDLTFVSIIVLAAMIFVLSAMVGYLYWQQTRLTQQVQSIALALTSHLSPVVPPNEIQSLEQNAQDDDVQDAEIAESGNDDRASVTHDVEFVEGPPETNVSATAPVEDDVDDIQTKTIKQLQDILTKKGIPFGKRDSKSVLIELIKATA